MDIKITKKRLNDHLSYDWIKYLAIILAAVLLWSLVFTMTKPRIPGRMSFQMFIITPGTDATELGEINTGVRKILDEDVILQSNITFWDSTDTKSTPSLISTRFATHEGDMLIVDNMQPKEGLTEEEAEKIQSTFKAYVDQGVFGIPLSDTIDKIRGITVDDAYIAAFKARVKKEKKFNKVDTEADMTAAIAREKVRVATLQDEAYKLGCSLGMYDDPAYPKIENLAFWYKRGEQSKAETLDEAKIWGINLAEVKDNKKPVLGGIRSLLLYGKGEEDDNTPHEYAMGLIFEKFNDPYYLENIKVMNYFIARYSNSDNQ